MPRSTSSSNGSVSCRLEWRPSRLLAAALVLIGALAVPAVLASALPRAMAWGMAAVALGDAICMAWRELHRPRRWLVIPTGEGAVPTLDGEPLVRCLVRWRGPLAILAWRLRDGRRGRLVWWPDTLALAQRRELRLAAGCLGLAADAVAMAP